MFEFLEAAPAKLLAPAPLVQVIAQVRFNSQSQFTSQQGVTLVQDQIVSRYPRLLAQPQAQFTALPGGMATQQMPQWRMTDLASAWSVVLAPEQVAVETSAYVDWSDMRERLVEVLEAISNVSPPRIRERVGLRYVNHIPAGSQSDFQDRVREDLLGVSTEPGWSDHLRVSLSQIVLGEGSTQLALRTGFGADVDPPGVFIVDIDCSDEVPQTFDAVETVQYFDQFNDACYRCFRWSVAEGYRSSLEGE